MNAAENTWSRRKRRAIGLRFDEWKIQYIEIINPKAMAKPTNGEVTMGIRTLLTTPLIFNAPAPAAISVAPRRPPTRAMLLELGTPCCQVMRFQTMAPMSADAMIVCVVVCSSTRPLPIVLATAVPANPPMKLKAAAIRMAVRGARARVATDVAMAFAVSWKPLT